MDNTSPEMFAALEKQIETLALGMQRGFQDIEARLDNMVTKDEFNERMDRLEYRMERVEFTTNGHENRISNLEDKYLVLRKKLT